MNIFRNRQEKELTDRELMEKYRSEGDLHFLGTLYHRYTSLVYGVCLKYLKDREISKDAVMDIFEHLIKVLQKHDVENFKSWLHVTTRNHCLMYLRKNTPEKHSSEFDEKIMEMPVLTHHEEENHIDNDLDALKKCIEKLNEEQKSCVSLFYLQGKCYQEIEDMTRFPLKKVKSYIQNGKRNLKICIEKSG